MFYISFSKSIPVTSWTSFSKLSLNFLISKFILDYASFYYWSVIPEAALSIGVYPKAYVEIALISSTVPSKIIKFL